MVKYYYAGGQRVAMRKGSSTLYFLLGDHLGSTSITANSSGSKVAELRYHPWGGTRYTDGTTPTSYRFTGQREDATIGLYFYNARYYDPALGRFISADTLVPQAGNPQSLNRYSYCLGSPVRYVDPTGRYSEDEIMQSFGVSTWDEVLAHFRKGGALEGRWGWLEMLRKAQDGDAVIERNAAQVRWYRGGLWPWQCEAGALCGSINGTFGRNEQGEILVSGRAHGEFALRGDEYALYKRNVVIGGHSYYASFETAADWIHYHPKYDWGRVDKEAIALDIAGIGLSFLEAVPTVAPAAMKVGWAIDSYSLSQDLAEWDRMGQPGPLEAMSIWLDMGVDGVGALPYFGILGDIGGIIVGAGQGIYWTP